MTSKYCERCRTKTKRYVTGRCKPCQRATDKRSDQRRQGVLTPYHYDKLIAVALGVNTQQFRNIQAYRKYQREWRAANKATATPGTTTGRWTSNHRTRHSPKYGAGSFASMTRW
jgi:hypothetical protein